VFAIASDVSPVAERGRAIGQVMVAFSVASVLGVPLGLEAARYGGWQAPFIALSVIGIIPLVFATRKLPVLAGHISQARVGMFAAMGLVWQEKYFLTLLMSFLAMAGAFLLIPNIAAIVQNNMGFPRHGMGLLYLGGGVISFFALSIAGKMVDKTGSLLPSWIGTLLFVLACLVGLGFELIYVPIAFTLFMVAMSMRNVSFSALSTKVPAPHERANFMSLLSAVQHVACALGAYGATLVLGTGENSRVLHVLELTVVATVLALSQPLLVGRVEKLMKSS
jgi:predicted MFS family arabinose efflux permease